ncbi:unnamed protein product [Rhizoctonia solani]|uniref:Uncharacterized protein n=1 Tax=Rhizoctonia solani TaxID=456999 RepID=A0A8H2X0E2_9AGAM|nr:unnamed protein product [Rhizoctonia solani]
MADFVYTYFLGCEELVETYIKAGGKIGTFNPDNPDDLHHARRAIFQYLQPGFMHVWYASLDEQPGMAFIVGEPDRPLRESVNIDLAKRCYSIFGRPPDPCQLEDDIGDLNYNLTSRDGKGHLLKLREFMQSDRHGDRYPLRWHHIPTEQHHLMR